MVTAKLFVEGGGDSDALKRACRRGFSMFLGKAGLAGIMPRIVACGGRRNAYESFCLALSNGEVAFLLVDSEAPVRPEHQQGDPETGWQPWSHLLARDGDGWARPDGARDVQCHLMVQCMESWLVTDRNTLRSFFGQGFDINALPDPSNGVEGIPKRQIYDALDRATTNCKTKGKYGKGKHSFKLLEGIDPVKVAGASGWTRRFIDLLSREMMSLRRGS